MGKLFKITVVALLFISLNSWAQEYKFGKISKEELLEKSYSSDSSANAAVLYESKKIRFDFNQQNGFQLITEVFKRVKLYNKEGFDYATTELLLYKNNGDKEKISNLKGVTYSIINDKIVETKLKKDGIFKNEYSENRDQIKFTMPSLQEGSVIEYKYKITSPFVYSIDRIYLQRQIPIRKMDVSVKMPEFFNFKKLTTGYLPINLKESSAQDVINLTSKSRSSGVSALGRNTKYSNNNVDYRVNINTISSENIPAFKVEPYSGNITNYISSINYELSYVKYPNSPIDYRSTTWEDVSKTIYDSQNFGAELKKVDYYKDDVDQLLSGVSKPLDKAMKIYDFVKQKMSWNKRRGVFVNDGVKKAYKESTGSVSEINLILTSMLTYAGINANPVICSTSDVAIPLFPTIDGFNYVITRIKLPDGGLIYLDATDKYGMPNILSKRIIKGMGRVIAKNGTSEMVDFRPEAPSVMAYRVQCEIDDQGVAKGKMNVNYRDYLAHDFRVDNGAKDDQSRAQRFQKEYGISELDEYTVKGMKAYGKGISEKFNFMIEDQIEAIEDEIFFSPLLFLRDKENIFKSDDRKYPVDFGYGFSNKYMLNIKIPDGYTVAECPKTSAFKLPDNLGKFSFRSNVVNGIIQVVVDETITAPVIPANYYPAIKEFYNQVIQKENEQIVLKKI
ncbi:transglutaminase domain-containing protein [uncultured Aquimarina sp.]|uniref:transglutaminase domain-containing protein n=1 Tax=uncultured Aquimarina sp. TaxID=575652 RepID=UPI0026306163|nr:transglutaminase domain-containing protein [uncultured Aquimarina sp.]